ncbi:restriction endonuclease subunit S [Solwaraspora sp. WMMD406]|uniref:restriction endonuclease subunit S n=1 Tax=Solwaraspora sp. WMMD406 TaxID=3016095 RepID=UPI0024168B15|nr:restriction endonuclease subunit S [Solwaraspora sp. WMMD406]MDG4767731.1 restriction endonuclease subunit S [Solwaraspora sp. WMMD406]
MSDIPPGWELAPLSELVAINQRRFDAEPDDDEQISFVPMASVEAESGQLDASQTAPYGELKQRSLTRFQDGDVLFAKVTPCMENGKIAVARGLSSGRGMGSTELFSLRSHGAIDPDYLAYYLLQDSVRRDAARAMTGAVGLRRVPRGYLEDLAIPVPPLVEQRSIVAALDGHLAALGIVGDHVKSAASRAAVLVGSACRHAVRGSLVSNGHAESSTGLELVNSLADSNGESIGDWEVPETWAWSTIGDLFEVNVGSTPSRSDKDLWGGGIPWVSSGEVAFCRIRKTRETIGGSGSARVPKIHPPGTVLLAMIGEGKTRGQAAVLDIHAAHNQNCASIRVSDTPIVPEYVYYFLLARYSESRRSSAGGNQPALNRAKVRDIRIPVPPLGIQRVIVAEIDRIAAGAEHVRAELSTLKVRLKALRSSLLAEAFAGQLVEQDPADEPASELLARIRAQRVVVPKQRGRRTAKELAAPATRAIGTDFQQGELPL